jgi:glutamate-1-semialdehyde 2,1-aminomutase
MSYSENLYIKANNVIPGGVNSPVRSFSGVGGTPIFIKRGIGCYLIDVDDNEYIDYVGSWGPLILGHSHPIVKKAITDTLEFGTSYGAPTEIEIDLAEKIIELIPNIEQIRMVNSGTEATMTAIRIARGVTKRAKIIKFEGCYHGHSDGLLAKAGSGVLTLGLPSSPGVPNSIAEQTITLPFNDLNACIDAFEQYGDDIAGVIVEPIAGNMGCILPEKAFLPGLRQLCDSFDALLIFDEVMTGFRVALGGAQQIYNIVPDLTTLGKVIGGGLPVGAVGGKKQHMQALAPVGPIYQAGTLSGNPLAMSAGLATLNEISKAGFYEKLTKMSQALVSGLNDIARAKSIPLNTNHCGGMFGFCFSQKEQCLNFKDTAESNIEQFKLFFHGMLSQGVYFAPSAFEAGFVSSAHTENEITLTLNAAENILSQW